MSNSPANARLEALEERVARLERLAKADRRPPRPADWPLSAQESRVFERLLKDGYVGREKLVSLLWGDREDGGPAHIKSAMESLIRRIRIKLRPLGVEIVTHPREGYELDREESTAKLAAAGFA